MVTLSSRSTWHPASWRGRAAEQQPAWPDAALASEVCAGIARLPPLVSAGEVYQLRAALARVALGQGLVVQAGDCAETFQPPTLDRIAGTVRLLRQASGMLEAASGRPVTTIGRIAGQFAKPRSVPVEYVNELPLPSFRGYIINGPGATPGERAPQPMRMLHAYRHSSQVLALLRQLGENGRPAVWASHEVLLLDYEEALIRRDGTCEAWILGSTHLPWIGIRTAAVHGAHVEFLSGVANPVGCKISADTTPAEIVDLCARLDPGRQPGRLVLISRIGADAVTDRLPGLVKSVMAAGHHPVWLCDPMHGNTYRARSGYKTRHLDRILAELCAFNTAVRRADGWPGGIHLEATAEDVTECVDDAGVTDDDLPRRYITACDPRLNRAQTIRVAASAARQLRGDRSAPAGMAASARPRWTATVAA